MSIASTTSVALPAFSGAPALERPAGACVSFIGGRSARVVCADRGPLGPVAIAGVDVVRHVAHGGVVERVRWTAGGLERTIAPPGGDGARVAERLFVPADVPLVAFEWSGAAALIDVETAQDVAPVELLGFPPDALEADAGSPLRARVAEGGRVVLVVAGGGMSREDVARRLPALVRARPGAAASASARGLALRGPTPALAAAVDWARVALAGVGVGSRVDALLAALALGDGAPAAEALVSGAVSDEEATVLASAHVAWTGQLGAGDPAERSNAPRPVALDGAPPPVFAVPDGDRLPFPSEEAAARFVLRAVRDLLGAEPDAPRARLRLGPRVPAGWDALDADRIRMGDAAVALRCRRDGAALDFEAEQVEGAAPIRLILEPTLMGLADARALRFEVDGAQASLDARTVTGGVAFGVQLVLDHARRVRVLADT